MKTESEVRRGTAARRAAPPDRGVRSGREAAPERGAEASDAPARKTRTARPTARQAAETERVPPRQAPAPSPDAARKARARTAEPGEGRTRVTTRPAKPQAKPQQKTQPKPQPKARPKARPSGGETAPASPAAELASAPAPARPSPERTRPARLPRPRRGSAPADAPATRPHAPAQSARGVPPRTPFVLLLVGLLCGGLITLLLLNTVLAQDSFRLGELREQNRQIAEETEKTRNSIARLDSPGNIAEGSERYGDRLDKSPPQFITPAP